MDNSYEIHSMSEFDDTYDSVEERKGLSGIEKRLDLMEEKILVMEEMIENGFKMMSDNLEVLQKISNTPSLLQAFHNNIKKNNEEEK